MRSTMKIGQVFAAILIVGLSACNPPHNPSTQGNKKVNPQKTIHGKTAFPGAKKQVKKVHGKKVTWWVYNQVNWVKDFYGLKINIEQIALTKEIPNIELGKKTPAIRVKFKLSNSTKKKFDVHPSRSTLSTSTGEDYQAAMYISNKSDGSIDPGESKTSTIGFYLPKDASAGKINWIRIHMSGERISSKALKKVKEKAIDTGKIILPHK
ncbi:MAG TPA: DUF4352 domain-containing protein [Bacillales bacterium]|nr:DUF4352 domain-containing protein [Bacillales bacterium]